MVKHFVTSLAVMYRSLQQLAQIVNKVQRSGSHILLKENLTFVFIRDILSISIALGGELCIS